MFAVVKAADALAALADQARGEPETRQVPCFIQVDPAQHKR